MRVSVGFTNSERRERQAPPPHPSPLKGEGVGGGVGLAAGDSDRAAKAEWMRQNLPTCTAIASDFRSIFPGCRMTYAEEAGNVVGVQMRSGQ